MRCDVSGDKHLSRSRLVLEHVIGVVWEHEGNVAMFTSGGLQRTAISTPVDLYILFTDENQHRLRYLRCDVRWILQPKLASKWQVCRNS